MTLSRAGMPLGKTDRNRLSRLTVVELPRADELVADEERRRPELERAVAAVLRPFAFVAAARCACLDWPATSCAWRRCAPRAAARLKRRPHSGQTNAPLPVVERACVAAERFLVELVFVALVLRLERAFAICSSLRLDVQTILETRRVSTRASRCRR